MTIDWPHFTPWTALAGGLLIGIAAGLLALRLGRIAGISGIVGGLLQGGRDWAWRLAFVAGMFVAPWLWHAAFGPAPATIDADTPTLVGAGLLVGLGTRYAGGCTSGHGVCGLSRGSLRSLVATGVFMAAGFVTVYGARHVLGSAP